MKKKGLIIATIVMVLVLAVSLTTATYAWFTTTAATTIESITVKAAAGADVKVGMKADNTYAAGANQDAFVSGSLTWADSATPWTGDPGMGFELNTGLSLASIAKATGYGTPSTLSYTADQTASVTPGHYVRVNDAYIAITSENQSTYTSETTTYTASGTAGTAGKFTPGTSSGETIIKASGSSSAVYDATSVEAAIQNTDYLHFVLGVSPSIATIDTITVSLFVNPGTNKNAIGVEAALYCYYSIDGGSFAGGQIYTTYGENTAITYNTTKTNISQASTVGAALNAHYNVATYTDTTVLNAGWKEIDIPFGTTNTAMAADTVHQVEIYIFYDGTDTDCINSALGSECGILFSITNTKVGGQ
ncbi:MAG: hypothetical protein J5656_04685 [Clostridia bacterium]|nr:hypothetical protein [Clostridia bacterium]